MDSEAVLSPALKALSFPRTPLKKTSSERKRRSIERGVLAFSGIMDLRSLGGLRNSLNVLPSKIRREDHTHIILISLVFSSFLNSGSPVTSIADSRLDKAAAKQSGKEIPP